MMPAMKLRLSVCVKPAPSSTTTTCEQIASESSENFASARRSSGDWGGASSAITLKNTSGPCTSCARAIAAQIRWMSCSVTPVERT